MITIHIPALDIKISENRPYKRLKGMFFPFRQMTYIYITADGHEGLDCINYLRQSNSQPLLTSPIGYNVIYEGETARNIIYHLQNNEVQL